MFSALAQKISLHARIQVHDERNIDGLNVWSSIKFVYNIQTCLFIKFKLMAYILGVEATKYNKTPTISDLLILFYVHYMRTLCKNLAK